MFRLLWSAAKTYLTVKAVEAVAKAFSGSRSEGEARASKPVGKRTAVRSRAA